MIKTDDPVRDAEVYMMEQEKWIAARPVCSVCGYPIVNDSALYIGGEWICDSCTREHQRWIEEEWR